MTLPKPTQTAAKAKRWLARRLIADVPEDLALCEFGCRKPACRLGEWAQCERRLRDLKNRRKGTAGRA